MLSVGGEGHNKCGDRHAGKIYRRWKSAGVVLAEWPVVEKSRRPVLQHKWEELSLSSSKQQNSLTNGVNAAVLRRLIFRCCVTVLYQMQTHSREHKGLRRKLVWHSRRTIWSLMTRPIMTLMLKTNLKVCVYFSTIDSKCNKNEPLQFYYNSFCLARNTLCFIKKGIKLNSAYFDNRKFKLYKNRSKHAWIIVHCDYEINVLGFVLCQSR